MRLTSKHRNAINTVICPLGATFHDAIPLGAIDQACRAAGVMLVDEANQPWQGLLCGREGRAMFNLASTGGEPIDNAAVVLTWMRFDSGRYEVVSYVS